MACVNVAGARPPNFVIMFMDDVSMFMLQANNAKVVVYSNVHMCCRLWVCVAAVGLDGSLIGAWKTRFCCQSSDRY